MIIIIIIGDFIPWKSQKSFITTNGRQDECINYISMVEGALEQRKNQVVEPAVEPSVELGVETGVELTVEPVVETPAQPTVETEYSDSEAERMAIAKKLYFATADKDDLTGLREYQLNLCKTQKYFLPEFAILVAHARVIIEDYANAKSLEGKAHPGSIQKIRVEIMRYWRLSFRISFYP